MSFRWILFSAIIVVIAATIGILIHLNHNNDYEQIQKLQTVNEQLIKNTLDYDIRMSYCDTVINALHNYLVTHGNEYLTTVAQHSLNTWQEKRKSIEYEKQALIDKVSDGCLKKAWWEALKKDPLTNIDSSSLADQEIRIIGTQMDVYQKYAISTVGNIIGATHCVYSVEVLGRGNIRTRNVAIDSSATVTKVSSFFDVSKVVSALKLWP